MYVFIDLASSAISLSDDRIIIIIARALYYLWVIAKLDVYRFLGNLKLFFPQNLIGNGIFIKDFSLLFLTAESILSDFDIWNEYFPSREAGYVWLNQFFISFCSSYDWIIITMSQRLQYKCELK